MKTDIQLRQDVLDELEWEPSVHAAQIGVEVKDGVVTLAGHVGSYVEKWAAERATQRVSGVKATAVEMDVKLSALGARTDADIARSAQTALGWLASVPKGAVQVLVEKGWITLSGEVVWQYQKVAATDAVRNMVGVTGVSDEIAIKPIVTMTAVKADIEVALKRRAHADAQSICVTVNGSDVTLTGSVTGWAERNEAIAAAWSTPGVTHVVEELSTGY